MNFDCNFNANSNTFHPWISGLGFRGLGYLAESALQTIRASVHI